MTRYGRPTTTLTPVELLVLRELVEGLSAREIAAKHGKSRETVKTHIERIYLKLGVHTRGAVVAVALRRGLVA